MNTRDKLIELFYENNVRCDQTVEDLADDVLDIIANGVTVGDVNNATTTDMVHRETLAQAMWERNVAMEQLEIHGIPFCGKVDVQAVRHGYWIDIGNNGTFQCSECGKNASKMQYCGNCGAHNG